MRKWTSQTEEQTFQIEEDIGIGFYLYVYESGKCVKDYLQDSFDFAVEQAQEEFGVEAQSWKQETKKGS
jgi:hypothetical protein